MDTYPCPACGGVADAIDGCRSCGRRHDPVAEALARINRDVAGLADDQSELRTRRARLQDRRASLTNAIALRLAAERVHTRPDSRPGTRPPGVPTQRTGGSTAVTSIRLGEPPIAAETSPRSAQNTLLTLGGVLLSIAAVVFAGVFYTTNQSDVQALILGIATTFCLGAPLLIQRTLTATAETIAGLGLVLLLLDGYVAFRADVAGAHRVSGPLFAFSLFFLVAMFAFGYQRVAHLRAPQFGFLLATQPLVPLIAWHLRSGQDGFAIVFAVTAAQNVGAAALLHSRAGSFVRTWRPPTSGRRGRPRMLTRLAWLLFGMAISLSAGLALDLLVRADTVFEAFTASLVLLLAASVGVVAGQLAGREALRHVATGAAALTIIGSVSRVNALALPEYTLVLTAATAAGIAVVTGFLPAGSRRGPQLGSLLGAALVAAVVTVSALGTATATARAAITPSVWSADLSAYAARVEAATWQVFAAAVLLAVFAMAGTPPRWRTDAAMIGACLAVFAAPGAGGVAWWAVPLLGAAASTVATVTSLFAANGRSAFIRFGSATLLGLHAVTTSLARPELTAAVCAFLAVVAAATVLVASTWSARFGPYVIRVADSVGGGAAITAPIAVGTVAWLAGIAPGLVASVTTLVAAVGVLAAALAQVAARVPRTGSAGGALVASIGCLVLAVQLDGATLGDIGVAVLVLVAATATAASRAFEVSPGGVLEAATSVPAAVSALSQAITGGSTVDEPPRQRRELPWFNGITASAALATAALILAMARLTAVGVPGSGLVTTTAMVLAVSLGVLALPEAWRRGPRLGGVAVGGAIAAVTATVAVTEAVRVIVAGTPWWAANLGAWHDRVTAWAPFGWQVPASLLLAAIAAAVLLPAPVGGDVGFVTLCLAGLAAPAAFGWAWWSPMLIAGSLALAAGVGAALVGPDDDEDVARRRLGLAMALGLYAAAAAAATAGSTVLVLGAIVGAGVLVAGIGQSRVTVPPVVPGVAAASALIAAPGAAATIAVESGSTRAGVLGVAMGLAAFGVLVIAALRLAGVRWAGRAAVGVGGSSLVVAAAALPGPREAQLWAAAAALVAVAAAATLRSYDQRAATTVVVATAAPAAVLAAIGSASAWLTALIGPYGTLRQIWQGYAVTPVPEGAESAIVTLLLLTAVTAAAALTLGGPGHLLAAILPPLAAVALVAPTAIGAPREVTPWVAIGIAVISGLGASLAPPTAPSATRLLRGTAGILCAVTGAAGLAGCLATRGATLTALAIILCSAAIAAGFGLDGAIRMVAWIVASAAGFALPVTALAAADRPLWPAAFGILAVSSVLIASARAVAGTATRSVAEAAGVELCAAVGAALALVFALGSVRQVAAVLVVWGLLLGAAALRRDRTGSRRQWLARAALTSEVAASWTLLYSIEAGLPESYTLPFAAFALVGGALELRERKKMGQELSSWIAYGPALAGGFLPSLVLVLVGEDELWRWTTLFAAAIVAVLVGTLRRRQAPVVTGVAVAIVVALTEMIRLLVKGVNAPAILVAVAGVVLIIFGAVSERRLRGAIRRMS